MDESTRTCAMTRIAEEAVPENVDLWPAIRTQVARSNDARPTSGRGAPVRRRALLGGIASAAALALALVGTNTWWTQPTSVSAETILDRAQATANDLADIRTYHLKMTQLRGGTTVDTEVWYGVSTKQRTIHRRVNQPGGPAVVMSESIFNGEHTWIILNDNGQTWAVHTIGTDWKKPGDDPSRASSLSDVLTRYASEKSCLNARQDGEATIAGRPAHVIVTTPKPEGCDASKTGPADQRTKADERKLATLGETRVWVDKQSFLLLKSETRDASGAVIERGEVTSIEYNVNLPDSTFTYTPPAGVHVREFSGASPDDVKRSLVEGDGKDGAAPPKKP